MAALVVAAAAYVLSPHLIEWGAVRALQGAGLEDVGLRAGHPGLRGVRLEDLRFGIPFGDRRLEVRAVAVQVGYRPGDLAAGRLGLLRLEGLEADWVAARTPAGAAAPPPWPGPWIETLPFEGLVFENAVVRAGGRAWTLSGHLAATGRRLSLALIAAGAFRARLELTSAGAGSAVLWSPPGDGTPALEMTLGGEGGGWSLDGRARLAPLAGLAARWGLPLEDAAGELLLSARGRGPAAAGTLRLEEAALTLGALRLWGVSLAGRFRAAGPGAWDLTLVPGGRLTLGPGGAGDGPAATLVLQADLPLELRPGALSLPAGLRLGVQGAHGAWRADGGALRLAPLSVVLAGGGWRLPAPARLSLVLPRLETPSRVLGRLGPIRLEMDAGRTGTRPPRVVLRRLEAGALGGVVALGRPLPLWPRPARSRTLVAVAGLDLARLVALEQRPELEASGRLDGSLPLELSPRGLRVEAGRLAARPPGGVIRYRPGPGARAGGSPELGLTYRVLEDFRYHHLAARVDYSPAGDLRLRVALRGRNPAAAGGRPVHLNLSLEENLPALLRSLGLAGELGGQVERRLRGIRRR